MLWFLLNPEWRKFMIVCWALTCAAIGFVPLLNALVFGDTPRVAIYGATILVAAVMAIRPRLLVFLPLLLVYGLLFGISGLYLRFRESAALLPVAQAAEAAVQTSAQVSTVAPAADSPPVSGKILIWDVTKHHLSDAYYQIPASLRATTQDQAMTVFLVWNIGSQQVDTYYEKGKASTHDPGAGWGAYRDTAHLAVVTWPGPRLVGWHTIVGENPAKNITLHHGVPSARDLHGDLAGPIVQWVHALPGVPAVSPPLPISWLTSARSFASSPSTSSASSSSSSTASSSGSSPGSAAWTEASAEKEAMRRYPQLSDANSPMNHAFIARYQQIKAENPSYLRDPSWPLRLANEVAPQARHQ
jgi:hypothetical protein